MPTGAYNNLNPYLYIFSLGEALRQGVYGAVRLNLLTVVDYVLLSAAEYVVFAPLYWYRLARNYSRLKHAAAAGTEVVP